VPSFSTELILEIVRFIRFTYSLYGLIIPIFPLSDARVSP